MEQEIRTAVELDTAIGGFVTQLAPIWIAIIAAYFGFLVLRIGMRWTRRMDERSERAARVHDRLVARQFGGYEASRRMKRAQREVDKVF